MAEPELPRSLRRAALFAATSCALPMLLQLPASLIWLLLAVFAMAALVHRRLPFWLRGLLVLCLGGVVLAHYGPRFGRDGASALLVAMLALKTLEVGGLDDARRLVGFALFAPFAAFLQDQGPLTLGLALPALIALLSALQALADPEALERHRQAWLEQGKAALLALLIALPLAMAGFWLFPRLDSPLWGMPDNAAARTGLSDSMAPGEWLDVMNDDTPAFRARFFGTAPPPTQMYWRGPVLSHFDGRRWTRADWLVGLPRPNVAPAGHPIDYEITLDPSDRRYLFALDLPEQVSVASRIGGDGSVLADAPVRSLLHYRARSQPPAQFERELPVLVRQMNLALPSGYNPRTLALAQQWRAEGSDDAAMVRRFLDWVGRDFSYSLETPLLGRNSVDEFLFQQRVGYCEHFSAALVVVMRAAGIPARVVTGYAGGYRNPLGDYWLIRQSDAHAWAEVWLADRGWQRVDPTAWVAPERVFDSVASAESTGALGALRQVGDFGDWARNGWNDFLLRFDAVRQRTLLRPLGIDEASAWQLSLVFSIAAGLALAFTLLWLLRGERRPRDPVLRAWETLMRRMASAGWPKPPDEPAQSYGERMAEQLPESGEDLRALSRRFAEWRYGSAHSRERAEPGLATALTKFRPPRRRPGVRP